ncbi:hypothetical protein DM860_005525 [Cuscuta australis]|uniref:SGNH hydrolase-type esterase domain-containing protein n=1 Tax=Cuscuta australis TaxID=267555 RepID=A0A328E3G9_9ASTE|nr:hypothetical protein DM860_005525 [Cuscuta australis]
MYNNTPSSISIAAPIRSFQDYYIMEKANYNSIIIIITMFLLCLIISEAAAASSSSSHYVLVEEGPKKLFVFGDSYADTGNYPPTNASTPWRQPYGISFPGIPSGRWSDGRVLTDYIASYLGLESPRPYAMWKRSGEEEEDGDGMNFAYGGTGVFETRVDGPKMGTQIKSLGQLVSRNVYTRQDLSSSLALVTSVGNDYLTFLLDHGNLKQVEGFAENLTRQLSENLKRIHEMGIPKVAVTAMEPMGCLPGPASSSSSNCNKIGNRITRFHNQLLRQRVDQLNHHYSSRPFVILDLYAAFTSALNIRDDRPGKSSFEEPLMPCCRGMCGVVDERGNKEYTVCDDRRKAFFFWDAVHPSQQGWLAVYSALKPSLPALLFSPHYYSPPPPPPHAFHYLI